MSSAEQAVRARMLALLQADGVLAGLVHGIFDGEPPRASAPFVSVGDAAGADWGTKDRAGREVRLTMVLVGVGEPGDGAAAMAQVEAAVPMLRGLAEGWEIVSARTVRTRLARGKASGWRHQIELRCRCLVVAWRG